jgi:ubiquinone biosynthesis protein COQ9
VNKAAETPKSQLNTANSENALKLDGFEPARIAILAQMLEIVTFDGWNMQSANRAAELAGIERALFVAAFPAGVSDILRYWSETLDCAMREAMKSPEFANLKIREKVAFAVRARIDQLRPHKEAARRASALMLLPPYGLLGARLAWKTADTIWRGLSDKSTDFNFYSKRGILTGVWTSVFARWLSDDSEDEAPTRAFLDARIENVMQIEKVKAKVRDLGLDPEKPIAWLAKMRYPA